MWHRDPIGGMICWNRFLRKRPASCVFLSTSIHSVHRDNTLVPCPTPRKCVPWRFIILGGTRWNDNVPYPRLLIWHPTSRSISRRISCSRYRNPQDELRRRKSWIPDAAIEEMMSVDGGLLYVVQKIEVLIHRCDVDEPHFLQIQFAIPRWMEASGFVVFKTNPCLM